MRKQQDPEKKRQRRVLIYSIFMILIMMVPAGVYFYGDNESQSRLDYGEYSFSVKSIGEGNVLVTTIDGQEVEFQSLPIQVINYTVDPRAVPMLLQAGAVALLAPPNLSLEDASAVDYGRLQLFLALQKTFNAVTEPAESSTLPVLGCANATASMPVLLFNISNDTKVSVEGQCIIMHGQYGELLRLKDRLIFEYIGIMQDGHVVE